MLFFFHKRSVFPSICNIIFLTSFSFSFYISIKIFLGLFPFVFTFYSFVLSFFLSFLLTFFLFPSFFWFYFSSLNWLIPSFLYVLLVQWSIFPTKLKFLPYPSPQSHFMRSNFSLYTQTQGSFVSHSRIPIRSFPLSFAVKKPDSFHKVNRKWLNFYASFALPSLVPWTLTLTFINGIYSIVQKRTIWGQIKSMETTKKERNEERKKGK